MAEVLARYPSKSNPARGYEIVHGGDGNVYCNCPAWRFQKGKGPTGRRCKHLDDYWRKENLRAQKILPATVWDRLTAELFDEAELTAGAIVKPKKKRKPKGAGPTAWERLGDDE